MWGKGLYLYDGLLIVNGILRQCQAAGILVMDICRWWRETNIRLILAMLSSSSASWAIASLHSAELTISR